LQLTIGVNLNQTNQIMELTVDKKKIASMRQRINRANGSFNVMGDMMLSFEIDGMSQEDLIALRDGLLASKKPLRYAYLDEVIERRRVKALELEAKTTDELCSNSNDYYEWRRS
jgi:hypothetical protein